MQYTNSWSQMNITIRRLTRFEERSRFAGVRPALCSHRKTSGASTGCGRHCSLGREEEDFFHDNFRVCKETYGNLLDTSSRLTHAWARRRGAEREREKDAQMLPKYENLTSRKIKPTWVRKPLRSYFLKYNNKPTLEQMRLFSLPQLILYMHLFICVPHYHTKPINISVRQTHTHKSLKLHVRFICVTHTRAHACAHKRWDNCNRMWSATSACGHVLARAHARLYSYKTSLNKRRKKTGETRNDLISRRLDREKKQRKRNQLCAFRLIITAEGIIYHTHISPRAIRQRSSLKLAF